MTAVHLQRTPFHFIRSSRPEASTVLWLSVPSRFCVQKRWVETWKTAQQCRQSFEPVAQCGVFLLGAARTNKIFCYKDSLGMWSRYWAKFGEVWSKTITESKYIITTAQKCISWRLELFAQSFRGISLQYPGTSCVESDSNWYVFGRHFPSPSNTIKFAKLISHSFCKLWPRHSGNLILSKRNGKEWY
jgi:hypothetical protein